MTLDRASSVHEALAVRDGTIVAVGRSADLRALAGPGTRVIDLQGRTVIPGLIDSHMHAIRAALSYATEVNWIGTRSIPEALDRIRAATRAARPGAWLIVAGGWTEQQFEERRRQSQAELLSAAPDHPVYIQLFYSAVLLTPAGLKALGTPATPTCAPRGVLERDGAGHPTGWIRGDNPTITGLFARLPPRPSRRRSRARAASSGSSTGWADRRDRSGRLQHGVARLSALFRVWQDHELTVRVAYSLFAQRRGAELEDFQSLTQPLPMGFGDDLLRFNGIGESVTWAMYNNDNPTEADKGPSSPRSPAGRPSGGWR